MFLGSPDCFGRGVDELGCPPKGRWEDFGSRYDLGEDVRGKEVVRDRLSRQEVRGELRRTADGVRNTPNGGNDTYK